MERSLVIPSDPAAIDLVETFLSVLAQDLGLSEDAAGDLIIAGTEAANNAILHGNQRQCGLSVRLDASVVSDGATRRLQVVVTDEGSCDWPLQESDPTLPEHLLDVSGRGLLIIRHLMDDVRIEPNCPGTRIILVKTLA